MSMATSSLPNKLISILFIILSIFTSQSLSASDECSSESNNPCQDKNAALPLKIIAIFTILISSIIGVCLPLFTKSFPALQPDKKIFVVVKAFASGIILATGFIHVLPDSFDMLSSSCLNDNPWHKFPFTGFVAMLSAIITLMVDSMATSLYGRKKSAVDVNPDSEMVGRDQETGCRTVTGQLHVHHHDVKLGSEGTQLLRYRVVAMVLELGIVVHSVVIGLSLGASNNTCFIRGLVAAMCFHQMFEGMGLGGCILQAEYKFLKKAIMVFFFAVTTPFGVALGMALTKTYKENSPTALITVGILNASSAGLLIYMALVDLLAADFMGPKLQDSIKLQIQSYIAVLLGAGGMSVMAKWA